MEYIKQPQKIEERSFEIITEELGEKNNLFSEQEAPIAKRVIHTTADFEYADLIQFKSDPIERGLDAIRSGCKIYTDTRMIHSGISKPRLNKWGTEVFTLIDDPEVAEEAKKQGITRSIVAMEKAVEDENVKIFAIGNAPTALITLQKLIEEKKVSPDLVIAVPVGFVGAEESKADFSELENIPTIVVNGRKGGSPVAAAIINALSLQA